MDLLDNIRNQMHLEQSELFSKCYEENYEKEIHSFSEISIKNIDDWFNNILFKYDFINEGQFKNIEGFFASIKKVLNSIDPEKLDINDGLVEDIDIMIWRESNNGISKLVFDEYAQIVYMFNGNDGRKIKGIFNEDVDMEILLYRFLSV